MKTGKDEQTKRKKVEKGSQSSHSHGGHSVLHMGVTGVTGVSRVSRGQRGQRVRGVRGSEGQRRSEVSRSRGSFSPIFNFRNNFQFSIFTFEENRKGEMQDVKEGDFYFNKINVLFYHNVAM